MISAIISAKNAEKTINIAVRSLLLALSKHDEVLVLFDGCSDSTSKVVARIHDDRLKTFTVEKSLGRSEGRNYLISRASGDYIAVLDADDICLPWRFTLALKELKTHDAVFGTALVFGEKLRPIPFIFQIMRRISSDSMALECIGRNPIVHSSATFRKSTLRSTGVAYRESEAEEYDLWLRMLNAGLLLVRTAIPVVMYRIHSGQASESPGFFERGMSCKYVIGEQLSLARKLGWDDESVIRVRSKSAELVRKTSCLANVEVLGLAGILQKFKSKTEP